MNLKEAISQHKGLIAELTVYGVLLAWVGWIPLAFATLGYQRWVTALGAVLLFGGLFALWGVKCLLESDL